MQSVQITILFGIYSSRILEGSFFENSTLEKGAIGVNYFFYKKSSYQIDQQET